MACFARKIEELLSCFLDAVNESLTMFPISITQCKTRYSLNSGEFIISISQPSRLVNTSFYRIRYKISVRFGAQKFHL